LISVVKNNINVKMLLMQKRKLTVDEINMIYDVIPLNTNIDPDIASATRDNVISGIKRQLEQVEVYPEVISKLFDQIRLNYEQSFVHPGEGVGCIAASSIGEVATQASLNSVEYNTLILIMENYKCKIVKMGEYVDEMCKQHKYNVVNYSGITEEDIILKNGNPKKIAHVCDISSQDIRIQTVNENGNVSWNKVTQLIRHPLYTRLIKVSTASGREVTATTGESFLMKKDGLIVGVKGSDLKVGDRLPITYRCYPPKTFDSISLRDYLPATEYIYGDDLWKAKEIRDHYHVTLNKKKFHWWLTHNGKDFVLPFKRSDLAMESLEGEKKSKIGKEDILRGCVYSHCRGKGDMHIPVNIALDEDFGFFIGTFLADGCVTKNYITITKYDQNYLNRIKKFVKEALDINYHEVFIDYKYDYFNRIKVENGEELNENDLKMAENHLPCEIRLHSKLFSTFIEQVCGKGSLNKKIPDFAYTANDSFLRGLFDGLVSGDGSINSRIIYSSISIDLINGFCNLLSRINVFGTIHVPKKQETNNKGSKDIKQMYELHIRGVNCNQFGEFMNESLTEENKEKKLQKLCGRYLKEWELLFVSGKKYEEFYNPNEDVLYDEITKIEFVETEHRYVYDLTEPITKNFSSVQGLLHVDSFHSSGLSKANLTTGVTRIKELLNASKIVKTPSCTIYLKSEVGDLTNLFIVKDFCDKELIYYDINSIMKDISIEYSPHLTPYEEMYYNFFKTFYKDFDVTSWRICITFSNELLYKIKKTLSYIAGCIKLALSMSEDSITIVFYPDTAARIDIWVKEEIDSPLQIIKKKKAKQGEEIPDDLPLLLNDENKMYFFIKEVIIRLLLECPISGMFGIEECYYTEDKNGEWFIDTKGSNFREIINHPLIDYKRCKSNNVWDVYEIFGIDAAKNFLEEEFGKNIAVNKRHLDLLTASMTTNGKISSVSRYGIDRKQVGPLAKICFEQPFDNVIQAALNGEKDRLVGASANITLGKHIKSGTGMVKLIMDTNHLKKLVSDPWTPTLMKKSLSKSKIEEEEQTMY
jgi:intein/homing endonuclease